ncbi:MAG: response regulator, partial [Candidatus Limnocylindria bacterium]
MKELILIVEDNDKNLKLARDVLRFHGFETIEATNAEDGIVLAQERRPNLVLMDIQLPGMDGVSALQKLRQDAATAAIPVVALTASVMKEDRERFDKAGFDGFITKPISVRAFPDQVR